MDDRDEHGRFVKGNGGGPGRPKMCDTDYLDVCRSTVTLTDWRAIVAKARDQAKRGNPVARKWLGDYLLGLPTQRLEVTGKDGMPLITVREVIVNLTQPVDSPGSTR